MTMLVGWIAVDQRSIASAYIAGDSRFTWGIKCPYDYGRKVFSFKKTPDIIAYCGDVLFPSIALARAVEIADNGLLFEKDAPSAQRSQSIYTHLCQHFSSYPTNVLGGLTMIYHVSRDKNSSFHLYQYTYAANRNHDWTSREISLPTGASDIIFTAGIGEADFNTVYTKYNHGPYANTSRNIFQCFCDCLLNNTPDYCGGAPQLVGLYRVANTAHEQIKNGIDLGITVNGKRYFLGAELDGLQDYDNIRWYNELFEICNGNTLQRKADAMPQPNPIH